MSGNPASAPNAGGAQNNQPPAGQQQVPPVQQPPTTPPAQQAPSGNQNQPPAQSANNQPPAQQGQFILSQEQFDQRWGEKLGGIEKDLGMPLKEVKAFIEANKKPPAQSTEPLSGADLRMAKMEALMLAGVPSKKIPGLLSRVQGKTKADIEADIRQMISEGFLVIEEPKPAAQPQQQQQQQQPPAAAQGAGNPGVPGAGLPKIWTRKEIKSLSSEDYEKNREDIMKAMSEGRVKD